MSGETKSKKKYEIDMCNGAILPKLLAFTLPLMCSSVLQLLFNAADIIVVGNFAGDTALAAVGSNTALINLLTNFFLGLSIGANVLVARFYGAKAEEDVSDTVHTAMLLSVFSGIILTVIGCIGARQILIWILEYMDGTCTLIIKCQLCGICSVTDDTNAYIPFSKVYSMFI